MPTQPSPDDVREYIASHLERALEETAQAVNAVRSSAAVRGISGSGLLEEVRVALKGFESGVDTALGELKRASRVSGVDQTVLRQIAQEELESFASRSKKLTRPHILKRNRAPNFVARIDEELAKFESTLAFKLRHYDNGLFDPAEPEAPPVAENSVIIEAMYGGAVQQGTYGSSQTVHSSVNMTEASAALDALAAALAKVSVDDRTRNDLDAEVATLRAQLNKSKPSIAILHEAGRSLRNILENAAGSLLASPQIASNLAMLLMALGLNT